METKAEQEFLEWLKKLNLEICKHLQEKAITFLIEKNFRIMNQTSFQINKQVELNKLKIKHQEQIEICYHLFMRKIKHQLN